MRKAVLQKQYAEIDPLLILGETSSVNPSWPEMYCRRPSLDKDGEYRRKQPDIERRRGDLAVSISVKNPQP